MSRLCSKGNFYRIKLYVCLNLFPNIISAGYIFVKDQFPHTFTAICPLNAIMMVIDFQHQRSSSELPEIRHHLSKFIFKLTCDGIEFYIEHLRHFVSCYNSTSRFIPANINDFLFAVFHKACLLNFIATIIIPYYVNNCKFSLLLLTFSCIKNRFFSTYYSYFF